jgi:hypothetical protein
MVLYAWCVCLCILASLRIPRSILRRQTLQFCGGSVTLYLDAAFALAKEMLNDP